MSRRKLFAVYLMHEFTACSRELFMCLNSVPLSSPSRRLHRDIFTSRKSSTFTNWHGIWRQLVSLTLFFSDVSLKLWLMKCTTQWKTFNTMENVQRVFALRLQNAANFLLFFHFSHFICVMLFNFLLFTSIHLHLKLKDIFKHWDGYFLS